jgi:hypothetical protein
MRAEGRFVQGESVMYVVVGASPAWLCSNDLGGQFFTVIGGETVVIVAKRIMLGKEQTSVPLVLIRSRSVNVSGSATQSKSSMPHIERSIHHWSDFRNRNPRHSHSSFPSLPSVGSSFRSNIVKEAKKNKKFVHLSVKLHTRAIRALHGSDIIPHHIPSGSVDESLVPYAPKPSLSCKTIRIPVIAPR